MLGNRRTRIVVILFALGREPRQPKHTFSAQPHIVVFSGGGPAGWVKALT